jgi:hypothetical protein
MKHIADWRIFAGIILAIVMLSGVLEAGGVASKKPQLPIQVSVQPAKDSVSPETIKPGDIVDLVITAVAFDDVTNMSLVVKLQGAELVSGELRWSGPAEKGQKKTFNLSVRAPGKGVGKVIAAVSFEQEGQGAMKSSAQYIFRDREESINKKSGIRKKDSRGRDIIEYE